MTPGLPVEELSLLAELVTAHTGLRFAPDRLHELGSRVVQVARVLGFTEPRSCLEALLGEPLTEARLEVLVGQVTVGETYFLRDPLMFRVLCRDVVPEIRRVRGDAPLRVWSAGCATGEEPYSIAITLREIGGLAPPPVILGTDIHGGALEKAARGQYGPWSFRNAPSWLLQRYFRQMSGNRFELVEEVRRLVAFAPHNVATGLAPPLPAGVDGTVDVVFCRNVLMYLTPDALRRAVRLLYLTLAPGGWLFVSATELSSAVFADFEGLVHSGVHLYRKPTAGAVRGIAPYEPRPEIAAGAGPPVQVSWDRPPGTSTPVPRPAPVAGTGAAAPPGGALYAAAMARECADAGRLEEALGWCLEAVRRDKMNPEHHYLHATVLLESDDAEGARRAVRRALYLDPDLAVGHVLLGNISRSRGHAREAQKHFRRARRLLAGSDPEAPVRGEQGITAGALLQIVPSDAGDATPTQTAHGRRT